MHATLLVIGSMDPIITLQLWLNSHGSAGFLISVDGGVDVLVGPHDWAMGHGSLAYLPVRGDRAHSIRIEGAVEDGEQLVVTSDPLRFTFSYWWTEAHRAALAAWERDRADLDVPSMLKSMLGGA